MIKIKRVYDDYSKTDGYRILVDRLWPRGISKENAKANEKMQFLGKLQDILQT